MDSRIEAEQAEPFHLVRYGRTLCGLTKWDAGNVDIEFGLMKMTTCVPCLRAIALECYRGTRVQESATTSDELRRPRTGYSSTDGDVGDGSETEDGDTAKDEELDKRDMEAMRIPRKWRTRYKLAKAQLDILPAYADDPEEKFLGTRQSCEEVIELIEEIAALNVVLADKGLVRLEARERLTALDWRSITESDLPVLGEEVWGVAVDTELEGSVPCVVAVDCLTPTFDRAVQYETWTKIGYTLHRPINAPPASPTEKPGE